MNPQNRSPVDKKPGTFTKGDDPRRNKGGMPQPIRDLKAALQGDAGEIHKALMKLVKNGNAQAVIYAHTQLIGKPKESVDLSGSVEVTGDANLKALSIEQLDQLESLLEAAQTTRT